jgi:hypothetical protein
MRSPNASIAADIAAMRSSSMCFGKADAMVNPSTLTTEEASISGDDACKFLNNSTMSCERVFIKVFSIPGYRVTTYYPVQILVQQLVFCFIEYMHFSWCNISTIIPCVAG